METFNYNGRIINIAQDTLEFERYEKDSTIFKTVDSLFLAMKSTLKATADFHNHLTEGKSDSLGNQIAPISAADIYLTDAEDVAAFSNMKTLVPGTMNEKRLVYEQNMNMC